MGPKAKQNLESTLNLWYEEIKRNNKNKEVFIMSDQKIKGKPKYESPVIVPLGEMAKGSGACTVGSSPFAGVCVIGSSVAGGGGAAVCVAGPLIAGAVGTYCAAGPVTSGIPGYCTAGTTASVGACTAGTLAETACTAGTTAVTAACTPGTFPGA